MDNKQFIITLQNISELVYPMPVKLPPLTRYPSTKLRKICKYPGPPLTSERVWVVGTCLQSRAFR